MNERFGRDQTIALATVDGENNPWVRTVNAYYENGSFYAITHARSNKMLQIARNPHVAISGEWFTAHGIGKSMGHILLPENRVLAAKLREVFSAWYDNGHTDESDQNTIILQIELTDGVLFSHGTRYDLSFMLKSCAK